MGCCGSKDERTAEIDRQIKAAAKEARNVIKLLLLGAGESGKSTVLKQMKVMHESTYTAADLMTYRDVVLSNTLNSLHKILEAMDRENMPKLKDEQLKVARDNFLKIDIKNLSADQLVLTFGQVADDMKKLWEDAEVQVTFKRANEYQLDDSAGFFLNQIDELRKKDFCPTQDHVLRSRVKTTGINETIFNIHQNGGGNLIFKVVDVGGQRSERKKWINCFDDVTAIIFVVAVSAYDQVLEEDDTVNRITESLNLFDSICNDPAFKDAQIILFLNKTDILMKKLATSPISQVEFPGNYYDPSQPVEYNYKLAIQYFTEKFRERNRHPDKQVNAHETNAVDTETMQKVISSVQEFILIKNLKDSHLIA
jgi:GTPase SAR1 family protein